MTTPNPAIIPGVLPGDLVPERADLLPEEPHLGNPDADSKDGMPNNPETPELVPGDI